MPNARVRSFLLERSQRVLHFTHDLLLLPISSVQRGHFLTRGFRLTSSTFGNHARFLRDLSRGFCGLA